MKNLHLISLQTSVEKLVVDGIGCINRTYNGIIEIPSETNPTNTLLLIVEKIDMCWV